ncbi:MAG: hypothetical protein HFK00_03005 [Oscillospiraceae bacterium]|nr:hypothetical protein [Oscillospiraceae bacterium]
MNLLFYTIKCLESNGKKLDDILWIGNEKFKIDIIDFMALSHQLELDGLPCIPPVHLESLPADLLIAGKDFWLSRRLSDIKEFNDFTDIWIFNSIPDTPQSVKKISALSAESLSDNENWEPFKVTLDQFIETKV